MLWVLLTFQDLIDDFKSELGGNFEETVIALMMPPDDFLVHSLNEALKVTFPFRCFQIAFYPKIENSIKYLS